ncbi:Ktr system potassium transporter B [Rhodobacterales bacterium]|nr:Ktr system potassium transporter B [Rhodobacterales bacterium]
MGIYAALAMTGAILLKVPGATEISITWSDAFFTAVSAVTVTGLSVVDTGSAFTGFGQVVILILIQLGGLGLMTFAVLVLTMLGVPMGFSRRQYLKEELNQTSASDLVKLIIVIWRVVVVCELAGAVLLSAVFVPEAGWLRGTWYAVFHSVSAFNNAGFALFPDSLSKWVGDPVINLVVPALFILGGLGFTVAADIYQGKGRRSWSVHTRLMLTGTVVLLVFPTLAFAALEWSNPQTLGQFDSIATKLMASWFQAASTRTAGFNTLDISGLEDATSLMFMTLMAVGAGSTSTGGGIKVTTFIVLILATIAFLRRRMIVNVYGRSLGPDQFMKVLAISMISVLVTLTGILTLSILHEGAFLDIAFEVVSAFGTVGLSHGITGDLDTPGRIVIMITMFIGRVGPLTLGFLLATKRPHRISYPTGTVYLG